MEVPNHLYDRVGEILTAELNAADLKERISTILRPRLSIDGNQWCALYGDNLQDGVAGFGDSPAEAMADFDASWHKKLTPLHR